jgi:membrane protease YdiL (CAAX protease family)
MDQPAASTLTVPEITLEAPPRLSGPRRLWREYVTDLRASANARATVTRETDRKMVIVFVVAALALTCNNFLSDGAHPGWLTSTLSGIGLGGLANRLDDALLTSTHRDFNQLAFWAVVMIVTYTVPAILTIKLVFHERIRDYGVRIKGIGTHGRTYLALYAIAAPLIIAFSFTAAFQEKYPFYHPAAGSSLWPYLYAWWVLYWLQFCALEFFFRGFMVHGLAPRLGWAAIFAMVVPYNMLHYGKPMPEALAAIVGGIVLGSLSLKTKSIWWGAALHISIAFTMDFFALYHLGRL